MAQKSLNLDPINLYNFGCMDLGVQTLYQVQTLNQECISGSSVRHIGKLSDDVRIHKRFG